MVSPDAILEEQTQSQVDILMEDDDSNPSSGSDEDCDSKPKAIVSSSEKRGHCCKKQGALPSNVLVPTKLSKEVLVKQVKV